MTKNGQKTFLFSTKYYIEYQRSSNTNDYGKRNISMNSYDTYIP